MNLTTSELLEIIKSCKDSGAIEITFSKGPVRRIVFDHKPNAVISPTLNQPSASENTEINLPNEVKFTEESVKPEREDEQRAIDELMISDPARYEEMIARGEIIDEQNSQDD